jgi:hypothetical protein
MKARVMVECDGRAGKLRPAKTATSVEDEIPNVMAKVTKVVDEVWLVFYWKEGSMKISCSLSFSSIAEREEERGRKIRVGKRSCFFNIDIGAVFVLLRCQ